MPRLVWRARALSDLERIHAWLSDIESADPDRTILHLRTAADSLERLGDIGRPSRVEGLRELSVRTSPYVIIYRMDEEMIDIMAVYHSAQRR